MGKTLSKRSVDITTENKKFADDEFTEKMEKIEDIDQRDVNGDATIEEKGDSEKKTLNLTGENDKEISKEKTIDSLASGDNENQNKSSPSVETIAKDYGATTAEGEEISPLADESIKKSKKEKVKKKWSFRNISFGKKDKQKPTKTDDAGDNTTTNDNIDEKATPTKQVEVQTEQTENPAGADSSEQTAEKSNITETAGNEGNEPTDDETLTGKILKETTVVVSTASQSNTVVADSRETEVLNSSNMSTTNVNYETISSSNCGNETIWNSSVNGTGSGEVAIAAETKSQYPTAEDENNKSIPAKLINEIPNTILNGDNLQHNGINSESEYEIEQSKANIEVKYDSDNIPNVSINCPAHPTNPILFNELLQIQDSQYINSDQNENIEIVDENKETIPSQIICERVQAATAGCDHSPPPLPESAPPSQAVAFVFAVKNAAESSENTASQNIIQECSENNDFAETNSIAKTTAYKEITNDLTNINNMKDSKRLILNDFDVAKRICPFENMCTNDTEGMDEHIQCYSGDEKMETIDLCPRNIELQSKESTTDMEIDAARVQESVKSTQQLVENIIEPITIKGDVKNPEQENVSSMDKVHNISTIEIDQAVILENVNIAIDEISDQIIFKTDICDAFNVNINRVNAPSSSAILNTKNLNNEDPEILQTMLPSDLDNMKKNDILPQEIIEDAELNLNSKDFTNLEELKEKVVATATDLSVTCE